MFYKHVFFEHTILALATPAFTGFANELFAGVFGTGWQRPAADVCSELRPLVRLIKNITPACHRCWPASPMPRFLFAGTAGSLALLTVVLQGPHMKRKAANARSSLPLQQAL